MTGSSFADVLIVNPDSVRPATAQEVAALEADLGVRMPALLNSWTEGWTFEAYGDRVTVQEHLAGRSRAAAADAVPALAAHAPRLVLGDRTTFFLPDLGARLALYQEDGEALSVQLSHPSSADGEVAGLLAAVRGT